MSWLCYSYLQMQSSWLWPRKFQNNISSSLKEPPPQGSTSPLGEGWGYYPAPEASPNGEETRGLEPFHVIEQFCHVIAIKTHFKLTCHIH